ncbi:MAG TPA: endonuclease/exonuclease/phosphatase family protein [Caldilineaceae bacterium]|nr:endonuclease/exonuclease/phosphatase family protein [Caldilineaceae bacterium]
MTFNIHGWRTAEGAPNWQQVVQVISASGADIVGLNEVYYPFAGQEDGNSHSLVPLLERLASETGMHPAFGPCLGWPATDTIPEKSYGNGLLSRWPIIASAAHHLTPVAGKEQRGLLEGRILLPDGRPFTVYVTHLDHTDEAARLVQLRALRTWTIRDRNRPHAVLGDFNAVSPWDFDERRDDLQRLVENHPPAGPLLTQEGMQVIPQMEKAGYVDAMRAAGAVGQGTFIRAAVPLRIDYIFLSHPLAPALRSAQVWQEEPGSEASDHRPVLVEIGEWRLGTRD